MSGEIIAILGVGVALAGLILTSSRGLRLDMVQMESRLDKRIGGLESQIGELRERMATSKDCWKGCARPSPDGLRPAKYRENI